jgi:hypothetical protein
MDYIIHLEFHHVSRVTKRSRFYLGTNLSMLEIFPHYERRPLQSNNLTLLWTTDAISDLRKR